MKLTATATTLLTLLNNAEELITQNNKRKESADVMRAIEIYAKGKNFPIPNDKFEGYYAVLLDARPNTLQKLIFNIANDVMNTDAKQAKQIKTEKTS